MVDDSVAYGNAAPNLHKNCLDKWLIKTKRPRCESSSQNPAVVEQAPSPNLNIGQAPSPNLIVEQTPAPSFRQDPSPSGPSRHCPEVDPNNIQADPGLRLPINILGRTSKEVETIRKAYLVKGPCQPRCDFPQTTIHGVKRRFNVKWYDEYKNWLEYSVSKDAAYCLYCYLFKTGHGDQGGGDAFVSVGYKAWNFKKGLSKHVGGHNSIHNQCYVACEDLMNPNQHIDVSPFERTPQAKRNYRIRLRTSIKAIKYLLKQAASFRGHDESESSINQGKFLELVQLIAEDNEEVARVVLGKAPKNNKLTAPTIQKQIASACATLTTEAIVNEIGDEMFSLLVDEARDTSIKEQMAVVLRYVNDKGFIIERFLGIVHVADTSAQTLKSGIENLFATCGLSLSRVRGQGYDGASNMNGEFNGLKALILKENPCAFYVHCFAHQLQLALVAVARDHTDVNKFFENLGLLSNVVGASCKRKEILREKHIEKLTQGLCCGEISSGQGLNQEKTLKRPGDTRWGSHYRTILSLISLFPSVVDVLEFIEVDGNDRSQRATASNLLATIMNFEFAFLLHLMLRILGITNDLSQALQKKDQDLVNAMCLVKVAKHRLQELREHGWGELLQETSHFCNKHEIGIPDMQDSFLLRGRSRRGEKSTNIHHFQVELFYNVIDVQLSELNDRFDGNTELLECMGCLDPSDSFGAFDKNRLIRFAEFYPSDFDEMTRLALAQQLENYIVTVKMDDAFSNVKGISELAKLLVAKKMDKSFPLVYSLVKLALILPVATASVERVFSAMNLIKTELRNRMGDSFLSDCMVTYVEKEVFNSIEIKDIMKYFRGMKSRRKPCN